MDKLQTVSIRRRLPLNLVGITASTAFTGPDGRLRVIGARRLGRGPS